jgi:hypothetical protein
MKKIINLTESDLVRIIKRVIAEQTKDGPVAIPKNAEINIDNNIIQDAKKMGINLLNKETPKTFLEKLNKSKVGINAFHVKQDYEFPIYPVYANIGDFRFSFEPFDKVNGQYRLKWTKTIPYKK